MTKQILAFLMLALPAFAAMNQAHADQDDCVLEFSGELTEDQTFICDGDLIIAPGSTFITKDHALTLISGKNIIFGSPENGVKILCTQPGKPSDVQCGPVKLEAASLDGSLDANVDAYTRAANSGDFRSNVASYSERYSQRAHSGRGGSVKIKRGLQDTTAEDATFRVN